MSRKRLLSFVALILAILVSTIALDNLLPVIGLAPAVSLPDLAQTYVTTFVGLFIEAGQRACNGNQRSAKIV